MSKKGLFKKAVAIAATGAMLASGTGTVWAGAYADAEKANLEAQTDRLAAEWGQSLEEYENGGNGTADIAVLLDDTGRSLISMFGGLDLSWLNRLGIKMDFVLADGEEKAVAQLYANEQTLATMLLDMNLAELVEKAMIPELSSSAIQIPIELSVNGEEASEKALKIYMDLLKDPKAVLPDGAIVKDLYDRYGAIVLDHMEDGAAEEGTLSVDGVEENYTLVEGIADAQAIAAIAEDILTTAKDDEQLAQIVKNVEAASEDLGGLYDNMQAGIEENLNNLAGSEVPEGVSASSKLFVNADGAVIGRDIRLTADGSDVAFTWKQPSDGDKTGFEASVTSDGETYGIIGSGTVTDGIANGVYNLTANGVALAAATVEDLDVKEGKSGTITIALNENQPDESTYATLGSANIVISLGLDEAAGKGSVDLAINYAGSRIGSIRISADEGNASVDISALDSAEKVYDASNDEEMGQFASELDPTALLGNLTAAGAPDGFVESLISLFSGSSSEYDEYDYDDAEFDDYEIYDDDDLNIDAVDEEDAAA